MSNKNNGEPKLKERETRYIKSEADRLGMTESQVLEQIIVEDRGRNTVDNAN